MAGRADQIGAIVEIMKSEWDLPADCNEGELYTYAEILFDRIEAGEDKAGLYAFAEATQAKLDMPPSGLGRAVVDAAIALGRGSV